MQYVIHLSPCLCHPPETEHSRIDVDPSKLSADKEIQNACCIKTCAFGMAQKNLTCDSSENTRCGHAPHGWDSFEQPEVDIKWACCQAGPDRPKFTGCRALLGDSTCPGNQRVRDDWENPFPNRDFTKMAKADKLKYCCKTSCYDQLNTRGLACPVATRMFDKEDFHNPFNGEEFRDKSDSEIQSKCCKPLNKCNIKLSQMSLSCDGLGSKPGRYGHEETYHRRIQNRHEGTNAPARLQTNQSATLHTHTHTHTQAKRTTRSMTLIH